MQFSPRPLGAAMLLAGWMIAAPALARGPSFDCAKARPGSIDRMICDDAQLSDLDRKLADIYAAATKKAVNEHPPMLRAEQIGWIRGRDDCWKSDDRRACVMDEYSRRIAELQARYRLLPGVGPVTYSCDGDRRNVVIAMFFATEPPTLIAERGDSTSLMYREPGGPPTKYVGRNERLEESGSDVAIVWGYGAPTMRCKKEP